MAQTFILVTTHRVRDGGLPDLEELAKTFVEFVEASEPGALGFQLSLSEDATELTHVLVQRDADAMDQHFRNSGALIGKALELAATTGIHVLGEPGPVLGQVLTMNADAGVPVSVQPRALAGFTRSAA